MGEYKNESEQKILGTKKDKQEAQIKMATKVKV